MARGRRLFSETVTEFRTGDTIGVLVVVLVVVDVIATFEEAGTIFFKFVMNTGRIVATEAGVIVVILTGLTVSVWKSGVTMRSGE